MGFIIFSSNIAEYFISILIPGIYNETERHRRLTEKLLLTYFFYKRQFVWLLQLSRFYCSCIFLFTVVRCLFQVEFNMRWSHVPCERLGTREAIPFSGYVCLDLRFVKILHFNILIYDENKHLCILLDVLKKIFLINHKVLLYFPVLPDLDLQMFF